VDARESTGERPAPPYEGMHAGRSREKCMRAAYNRCATIRVEIDLCSACIRVDLDAVAAWRRMEKGASRRRLRAGIARQEWGASARGRVGAGHGVGGGSRAAGRGGSEGARREYPVPLPARRVSTMEERGVWTSGPELVRPSSGRLEASEQRISCEI
jgi:hypothetical protein